jgi:Immunity protein 53
MNDTDLHLLSWLQHYYQSCCDGDWEHGNGIQIHTLDNPGWRISISLRDTMLETMPFERQEAEKTDDDWYHCWRDEEYFHGVGGALNLVSILSVFRAWVDSMDATDIAEA